MNTVLVRLVLTACLRSTPQAAASNVALSAHYSAYRNKTTTTSRPASRKLTDSYYSTPLRTMAALLSLPNELLIQVANHFYGRNRNRNLASLSLVCRRFRNLAQEELLCAPRFRLAYIHKYLWELGHHSAIIPRIRRLEIFSTSDGRRKLPPPGRHYIPEVDYSAYPAVKCPPEVFAEEDFISKCREMIEYFTQEKTHCRLEWLQALEQDIVPALFGVLIVSLPNLRELCLGATWMMDFPVFSLLQFIHISPGRPRILRPKEWRKLWMNDIILLMGKRLRVLEFPADLRGLCFGNRAAVFGLSFFRHLRCLSLSMDILQDPRRPWLPPHDPAAIFPASLRLLRISECKDTTANFMNELCLAKKNGKFPHLHDVQLYFKDEVEYVKICSRVHRTPHPVHAVRRMCTDAGMSLYLYFPIVKLKTEDIGATPWSFQEEGMLTEVEVATYGLIMDIQEIEKGPTVIKTDFQGDIEMMD